MLFLNTETARINHLIEAGAGKGLSELEFFGREIAAWKGSPERQMQITGDAYYCGKHDILKRKRTSIGPDGALQTVDNLPNNKILDNQYAKMVDQKTNYLFGKPITFDCDNEAYLELLEKAL